MTGSTYSEDDREEELALANELGGCLDGHACDVILLALCRVVSGVMVQAVEGDEAVALTALYAGLLVNVHQATFEGARPGLERLNMVGEGSVTAAEAAAATLLCPPLSDLMVGLLQHFETKNVLNAWFSTLINAFLNTGGLEAAQAALRETADALPKTVSEIDARHRFEEMAAGVANTDQVGRA